MVNEILTNSHSYITHVGEEESKVSLVRKPLTKSPPFFSKNTQLILSPITRLHARKWRVSKYEKETEHVCSKSMKVMFNEKGLYF